MSLGVVGKAPREVRPASGEGVGKAPFALVLLVLP